MPTPGLQKLPYKSDAIVKNSWKLIASKSARLFKKISPTKLIQNWLSLIGSCRRNECQTYACKKSS